MQDQGKNGYQAARWARLSSESCLQPRSALSETDNNPLPSYAARLLIRALTLSHSHPDMVSTELFLLLRCFLPFFFSFPRVSCETDLEEAQRFVSPGLGRDLYLCCWKKKGSEIVMAIFRVFSGRGTNSLCLEEAFCSSCLFFFPRPCWSRAECGHRLHCPRPVRSHPRASWQQAHAASGLSYIPVTAFPL